MENKSKSIYILILELYECRKNKEVVEKANKYLEMTKEDDKWRSKVRFLKAKSLRYLGYFEESINELEKLVKEEKDNSHFRLELFRVYYYLNRYEEALKLLPELYNSKTKLIANYSLLISELVMKKHLNIPIKFKKGTRSDYIKTQIIDYDENLTLEHIKNHMHLEDSYHEHSLFNSNVDIDYLYECVKNNLDKSKKVNANDVLEVHFFSVYGIGYNENSACNYLKVIVCPNTKNIISMYPFDYVLEENTQLLDYDNDKLFKRNIKEKNMSRIDRFNKKYNM